MRLPHKHLVRANQEVEGSRGRVEVRNISSTPAPRCYFTLKWQNANDQAARNTREIEMIQVLHQVADVDTSLL
jgi:hypothetical protein